MSRQLKRRIKPGRQLKRRSKPWPYTFDYDNEEFMQYFRSVTGIQIGKEEKKELARFLIDDPTADNWVRTSKNFKYLTGKIIPFGKDREDQIRVSIIMRGRLQEEWNNYQKTKVRKLKRRSQTPWPYTYDYEDKKFLKYFRSATGIQVGKQYDKKISRFLLTNARADHWLRTSEKFKYSDGEMVPFKYREDSIKMNQILKDNLQKHWDIYNKPRKLKRRPQ